MAIRLVLVRHGLSSFNAKGLIQGRTDDSFLTDEGYEQALKAGKALSKINFDKIYSSPLVRAAETAKTIKKSFNNEQEIIFNNNLLEVDLSEWSGLKIDEIKNKFPEIYPIWKNDPENLIFLKPCLGLPNKRRIKHLRIALCPTIKIFISLSSK